jgi:hypothetical protein
MERPTADASSLRTMEAEEQATQPGKYTRADGGWYPIEDDP